MYIYKNTILLLFCLPLFAWHGPMDGAHLERVKVSTTASFRGLHVLNEKIVWASGTENTVLITEDNGQSWRTIQVGKGDGKLDFRDVWVKDPRTAWLMAAGPDASSCIYGTVDGGNTWQLEHRNALKGAFFDGFTFQGEVGTVYSDPVDGAFLLLRRKGSSWERMVSESMPPALVGEASFAASGTGIVALENHLWFGSGGASVARVFHSPDQGKSWQVYKTPLRAGNPAAGVFSLAFRKSGNGVAMGGKYDAPDEKQGIAAFSDDFGKTWQLAERLPRGFHSCVVYVPGHEKTLVAVGTNGADYSTDDGRGWLPLSDLKLNVIKFGPSIKQGWAVGPDGMVARLHQKH